MLWRPVEDCVRNGEPDAMPGEPHVSWLPDRDFSAVSWMWQPRPVRRRRWREAGAPPENGHRLQAQIGRRATLVDLPGIGHTIPIEDPDLVAAAVLWYLRGS